MEANAEDDGDDVNDLVLDRAVTVLREHFDTVQIFVSKQSEDDSQTWDGSTGAGNFLARKCQVMEWITRQEEMMREHVRHRDDE